MSKTGHFHVAGNRTFLHGLDIWDLQVKKWAIQVDGIQFFHSP